MSKPDLFRTITGDDWKRSLARAKRTTNSVSAQISARMTADQLKARFPNASPEFLRANARPPLASPLPPAIAQHDAADEPLAADRRKENGNRRSHVRIERRSLKLLDKDNLYGSVKWLCDAMRYGNLIPDDDPESIELTVTQLRVRTRAETGTAVTIAPEPVRTCCGKCTN